MPASAVSVLIISYFIIILLKHFSQVIKCLSYRGYSFIFHIIFRLG